MTQYLRVRPVTGGPDEAYRNFDGAGIVSFAFALTDWWGQWRIQTRSAAETLRFARAVPFSLTLLAAIECGAAVAAEPSRQSPADAAGVTDGNRCTKVPIEVMASSPEERAVVCAAAADALGLLGRCGIAPRWTLRLEIMPQVRHPLGRTVLGLLDTKRQRILVTQAANLAPLIEETPYTALPPHAFFSSLIVHEVVHAVMDQNLKRPSSTHAAYEYPAYALQIESLGAEDRDNFLSSFDQAALKSDALFNDVVLFFDPYLFAARAYYHFKRSPDGCGHLNALLQGEVPFIASLEMQ